jgi:predicted ATP-dependent endonuclease of OLD family
MLKRIQLKNWRSCRNVTVDLSPITVLIGANSSGKTNIVEALQFYRDSQRNGIVNEVRRLEYERIQSREPLPDATVEIAVSFDVKQLSDHLVTDTVRMRFDGRDTPFLYGRRIVEGDDVLKDEELTELPYKGGKAETKAFAIRDEARYDYVTGRLKVINEKLPPLSMRRWQMLSDQLAPEFLKNANGRRDVYMMSPDASNTLDILNFLREAYSETYEQLQGDLAYILRHVRSMRIREKAENRELKLFLYEEQQKAAPTISAGTSHMVAALAAIYALDMPDQYQNIMLNPEDPGLVIIEEPDTALNPGVLRRFVEQLRLYAENTDKPRQFILTTHNPTFLNHFQPDEVRVVERDDNGYTQVHPIPDAITEIWLKDGEYALGEVWMTNAFGGLAE